MMNSQFHTKALNPVDIAVPDNLAKGAIVVDKNIGRWNPKVIPDPTVQSTYFTINKECDDVSDLVVRVAQQLKLPLTERYALMLDSPRSFLTNSNLHLLKHGFLVTFTASADKYIDRILESLSDRSTNTCETILADVYGLCQDAFFVGEMLSRGVIWQLFQMVGQEIDKMTQQVLLLVLQSLYAMMELSIDALSWENVPENAARSACALVSGRSKIGDTKSVNCGLHWVEQLLNSKNEDLVEVVFVEIPFETLLRHLDSSDFQVALSTLSLMNTFYRRANIHVKSTILSELTSAAFRNSVSQNVLREGRAHDRQLLDQLIPIQKLLLGRWTQQAAIAPSVDDIYRITANDFLHQFLGSETDQFLANSPYGALLANALLSANRELILTICMENAMRDEASRWEVLPFFEHVMRIVVEVLGILTPNDDNLYKLMEFLFSAHQPTFVFFGTVARLFHKTWREMHAVTEELDKVSKVVAQQLSRAINKRPSDEHILQQELDKLPYSKMKEIWEQEDNQKEIAELGSEIVNELRSGLRPSIEQLVRKNRKNFMKQGYTFKKYGKSKSLRDQYMFWKLDQNEKELLLIECDVDPFVEGIHTPLNQRKVHITQIADVVRGDENDKSSRKSSSYISGIRLSIFPEQIGSSPEVLVACAHSERDMFTWLDGLRDLINKDEISEDTRSTVDRLLNIEVRLRLIHVPHPSTAIEPAPLPEDFSWIPKLDD